MADITIKVSRIGNSTNLSLKQEENGVITDPQNDSLDTEVDLNQTIKWKVDPSPDSGRSNDIILEHIKAKDAKGNYINSQQILIDAEYNAVYTSDPKGIITGTVVATAPTPKKPGTKPFENYQIGWRKSSESAQTEHWDDPKLIMR
ncbi:MAG: hypothetical protein KJO20_07250 [Eudoraea sp.]|nr:hypothetical protein [Eudoraea sp.]NNK31443.1 hypothetical protein [Flavobacteriaceae bacterium]